MRRRRQEDYRFVQAKYELALNDEDEIDFNIQAMRRPMIIGTKVIISRKTISGIQTFRRY